MNSLNHDNKADVIKAYNSTSTYQDDHNVLKLLRIHQNTEHWVSFFLFGRGYICHTCSHVRNAKL